jgi:hypothetical protein
MAREKMAGEKMAGEKMAGEKQVGRRQPRCGETSSFDCGGVLPEGSDPSAKSLEAVKGYGSNLRESARAVVDLVIVSALRMLLDPRVRKRER